MSKSLTRINKTHYPELKKMKVTEMYINRQNELQITVKIKYIKVTEISQRALPFRNQQPEAHTTAIKL